MVVCGSGTIVLAISTGALLATYPTISAASFTNIVKTEDAIVAYSSKGVAILAESFVPSSEEPSPPTTTPPPDKRDGSSGMGAGAVTGIVVGVLVLVAGAALAIFKLSRVPAARQAFASAFSRFSMKQQGESTLQTSLLNSEEPE